MAEGRASNLETEGTSGENTCPIPEQEGQVEGTAESTNRDSARSKRDERLRRLRELHMKRVTESLLSWGGGGGGVSVVITPRRVTLLWAGKAINCHCGERNLAFYSMNVTAAHWTLYMPHRSALV